MQRAATATSAPRAPAHERGEAPVSNALRARMLAAMSPAMAVQMRGAAAVPAPEVHAAAAAGIATPSSALPYREALEASLGRDLSGIRAHVGGEASESATAMGARAYATGEHVVLPPNAGLHTVAHEVTHVLQQRGGVQLEGGVGTAGDRHEQHADRVADAVVRGEPASHLIAPHGGPARGAAVQRQAAPATGTAPPTKPSHDPYEPTWDEIVEAAKGDPAARGALDIGWIEGSKLGWLRTQIDQSFQVGKEHEAADLVRRNLRAALTSKYRASKAGIEQEARARLGRKVKKAVLEKDATYAVAMAALDATHTVATGALEVQVAVEAAGQKRGSGASSTKVAPPAAGLTWMQGRVLARVNFMAWGIALLGSAKAVKEHFEGVEEVPGASGNMLARAARERFVEARTYFEKTHPGSTFRPSIGQAIRGRHQADHARGHQGHPLGISVDFDAAHNPHQDDPVARFMLKQFGGEKKEVDGEEVRVEGKNRLVLGDRSYPTIKQMGIDTDAGRALSKQQLAFLARAAAAYQEMFETSKRFQASLPAENMAVLREAQATYYASVQPGRARLAEIAAALKKARAQDKIDALVAEQAEIHGRIDPQIAAIDEALRVGFAPWIDEMKRFVVTRSAQHDDAHETMKIGADTAASAIPKIREASTLDQLHELRGKRSAFRIMFADLDPLPEDLTQAQNRLIERAKAVSAARRAAEAIWYREELINVLGNPRAVFGAGERRVDPKTKAVSYVAQQVARNPPVMQYLELGIVRNDDPTRRGVFNSEFIQAMMRHGWYSGAAWEAADTMHFDFLEGYDQIVGDPGKDKKFGPTD